MLHPATGAKPKFACVTLPISIYPLLAAFLIFKRLDVVLTDN